MALDLKQGLSKQITKINMKTSTFLEETKIRTYITTLENEIQDLKVRSGELGYTMWASGNLDTAQLIPLYSEIAAKQRQIVEQENQIKELALKNQQVLGQTPVQPSVAAPAGGAVICPKCGEACGPSVKFCRKCGNKLQ